MATLERPKKNTTTTATFVIENDESDQESELISEIGDITADSILESLANEPMEYPPLESSTSSKQQQLQLEQENSCCLSEEVITSLQSVKHICLSVLDLHLQQIVKDLPHQKHHHLRRFSESSCYELSRRNTTNLLGSITQNTNLLQQEFSSSPMIRSNSSPPAATMSDVSRILDSNQCQQKISSNPDYTLCCSLAALLNDVYRLLELNSISVSQQQDISSDSNTDSGNAAELQQQLHDKVSTFQRKRVQGIMTIDTQDATQEMMTIWEEMDHLMNIVSRLAVQHKNTEPPSYNDTMLLADFLHSSNTATTATTTIEEEKFIPPPAYNENHSTSTLQHTTDIKDRNITTPVTTSPSSNGTADLDKLLTAIDKLSSVAPRLNNQRVDLTPKQLKDLAAATLGKTVERLSRGRLESQRACSPSTTAKHQVLHDLVHQIHKSASRSLDNQRVAMPTMTRKKSNSLGSLAISADSSFFASVLDRFDRGRCTNQEWISQEEEILVNDLRHTTNLLIKSLERPAYTKQRCSISKERNSFMSNLLNKVENMEGHRMMNQDAVFKKKEQALVVDDELQQIFNNIYKSKSQLDNQRASFSL